MEFVCRVWQGACVCVIVAGELANNRHRCCKPQSGACIEPRSNLSLWHLNAESVCSAVPYSNFLARLPSTQLDPWVPLGHSSTGYVCGIFQNPLGFPLICLRETVCQRISGGSLWASSRLGRQQPFAIVLVSYRPPRRITAHCIAVLLSASRNSVPTRCRRQEGNNVHWSFLYIRLMMGTFPIDLLKSYTFFF